MEEDGLLVLLEAKPGRGEDLGDLLRSARDAAIAGRGSVEWRVHRASDTTWGVYDSADGATEPQQACCSRTVMADLQPTMLEAVPDVLKLAILSLP